MPSCVDDGDGNDEEAIFLCLHVLLEEVELELVFEVDDVVDEFEFGVEVVDELEEEEVPDKSAKTGTGAFGAGVGIEA